MTKKHFEAIADILKETNAGIIQHYLDWLPTSRELILILIV